MGRLPLQFAGRDISFRIPYNVYAEMEVASGQTGEVFPDASFTHNVDKPFEIHRLFVRLTGIVTSGDPAVDSIPDPQPTTLDKLVKLRIQDLSKNESLTKNATRVDSMLPFNTGSWELEEPYTLVRSEGFQVQVDTDTLPNYCFVDPANSCESTAAQIDKVRVELNWQGYLVIVAPPTETR